MSLLPFMTNAEYEFPRADGPGNFPRIPENTTAREERASGTVRTVSFEDGRYIVRWDFSGNQY